MRRQNAKGTSLCFMSLRVYVLLYLCIMPFMFKLWKCVSFGTLMFVRRSSVGF